MTRQREVVIAIYTRKSQTAVGQVINPLVIAVEVARIRVLPRVQSHLVLEVVQDIQVEVKRVVLQAIMILMMKDMRMFTKMMIMTGTAITVMMIMQLE